MTKIYVRSYVKRDGTRVKSHVRTIKGSVRTTRGSRSVPHNIHKIYESREKNLKSEIDKGLDDLVEEIEDSGMSFEEKMNILYDNSFFSVKKIREDFARGHYEAMQDKLRGLAQYASPESVDKILPLVDELTD